MKIQLQNLNGVRSLSAAEQSTINGGAEEIKSLKDCSNPACDLGYFVYLVAQGLSVFATEGGRNAGLVVR